MTCDQYYYRLGDEDPGSGFLWSGSISTDKPVTLDQAKILIRKSNDLKRLPASTIIVSVDTLQEIGNLA